MKKAEYIETMNNATQLAKDFCSSQSSPELPEAIEAEKPICPHCDMPYRETEREFVEINCSCGWKFEVKRVYISRALENRQ